MMTETLDELLAICDPENSPENVWETIEKRAHITEVKVKRLHPDAVIPVKAHVSDAGLDLVAVEDTIIEPGETALIKTGLAFELPEGYEMQIRPRSGVTLKTKLRVQLGTVDCNYRGEVGVIVDNTRIRTGYTTPTLQTIDDKSLYSGKHFGHKVFEEKGTYLIRKGDRIAQAVIHRLPDVELVEVVSLGDSERGEGAYGSTGV